MYTGNIIDTHMHLWDLKNDYPWLKENVPTLVHLGGNYDDLKQNFLVKDYAPLTRDQKVVKSIHVEAFGFDGDPVHETQWLQQQADQFGFPHGIIARAELHHPDVETILKQHCQYPSVRGIRMALNYHDNPLLRMADRGDYLKDNNWRYGFSLLSKYNLAFELQVYNHQIEDVLSLISDFPRTTVIIEHFAWPLDLSVTGFEKWKQGMKSLAKFPNVFMKLSGFGWVFKQSELNTLQIYIDTVIQLFGPHRCMFGSNFPPDRLFYNFNDLVNILKTILKSYPDKDQKLIFCENAERIYRL